MLKRLASWHKNTGINTWLSNSHLQTHALSCGQTCTDFSWLMALYAATLTSLLPPFSCNTRINSHVNKQKKDRTNKLPLTRTRLTYQTDIPLSQKRVMPQVSAERGCLHAADGSGGAGHIPRCRSAQWANPQAPGAARPQRKLSGLRQPGQQRIPWAPAQRSLVFRKQRTGGGGSVKAT